MQQHEPLSVLLAVKPGLFRYALQNLLGTMPDFDVISLTGDLTAALSASERHCPAVALIDFSLIHAAPDNAEKLVKQVGREGGHCIVITQNFHQQEMIEEIGAIKAVVQGIHPQALLQMIEELITTGGEPDRFRYRRTLPEQPSPPKLA